MDMRSQRSVGPGEGVFGKHLGFFNSDDYEARYPEDPAGRELGENARVWRVYQDEAAEYDLERVTGWRETIDNLSVFASLFSAILTAFLALTVEKLQPDYPEIQGTILVEILKRLSQEAPSPNSIPAENLLAFAPRTVDLRVNALWFTSLAFSLTVAFFCVLIRQWLRHYMASTKEVLRTKSFVRQYRLMGLKKWKVSFFIELLPVLMSLSLFLFLVGLDIYLIDLHQGIAGIFIAVTSSASLLGVIANIIPVIDPQCPYVTPVSVFLYWLVHSINVKILLPIATRLAAVRQVPDVEAQNDLFNHHPSVTATKRRHDKGFGQEVQVLTAEETITRTTKSSESSSDTSNFFNDASSDSSPDKAARVVGSDVHVAQTVRAKALKIPRPGERTNTMNTSITVSDDKSNIPSNNPTGIATGKQKVPYHSPRVAFREREVRKVNETRATLCSEALVWLLFESSSNPSVATIAVEAISGHKHHGTAGETHSPSHQVLRKDFITLDEEVLQRSDTNKHAVRALKLYAMQHAMSKGFHGAREILTGTAIDSKSKRLWAGCEAVLGREVLIRRLEKTTNVVNKELFKATAQAVLAVKILESRRDKAIQSVMPL